MPRRAMRCTTPDSERNPIAYKEYYAIASGAAPPKTKARRRLDEEEEAAERVSDDTEEMETVLTSMDATSILTSGGVQVVSTAAEVATASVNSIPYTRRKGKEKMVESDTPKKKKLQEQIDVQVARELEEEMARDT
nr:hypothetical protein [Tanacetum cinerariifolium]